MSVLLPALPKTKVGMECAWKALFGYLSQFVFQSCSSSLVTCAVELCAGDTARQTVPSWLCDRVFTRPSFERGRTPSSLRHPAPTAALQRLQCVPACGGVLCCGMLCSSTLCALLWRAMLLHTVCYAVLRCAMLLLAGYPKQGLIEPLRVDAWIKCMPGALRVLVMLDRQVRVWFRTVSK